MMLYSAALVVQTTFPQGLIACEAKDITVAAQTQTSVDPLVVAREFAELLRDEPDAAEVWMRPTRDLIEIHLITAPTDAETERRFAEAFGILIERHHHISIAPRVHNPRDFANETDLRRTIPHDAISISLQR